MSNIYDPKFVQILFNKMSASYERVNLITSFGFSQRWRREMVNKLPIQEGSKVVDLLCGMGECWNPVLKKVGSSGKLIGLDFSSEMVKTAKRKKKRNEDYQIEILEENIFNNSILSGTADFITCGFGLKTFDEKQLAQIAEEVKRILKPGGEFSFADVSTPDNYLLRFFYLFYLEFIIPVLGLLLLGNPSTYRMLGIYTKKFKNAKNALLIFEESGLVVTYQEFFFGCATGFTGRRIE